MTITGAIITCICAVFAVIGTPSAEGWRGIMPLHSTRVDVERVLGSPQESRGVASTYETQNEKVLVFYAAAPCERGNEWNILRDTVISLTVSPKAKLLLASLRLNKDEYKRVLDPHVQGIVHYFNEEEGVRIDVRVLEGEGEDVNSITYEPAAKDNHLRCLGAPAPSEVDVAAPPPHKFDEYSNIFLSDEKARLDNFAVYLQQNPKLMGYIIAYAGRRAHAGQAKARAERTKSCLTNGRSIEAGRIVTVDGGYRKDSMIELYVALRGTPAPAPTPTVDPSEVHIIKSGNAVANGCKPSRPRRKSPQPRKSPR